VAVAAYGYYRGECLYKREPNDGTLQNGE